MKKLILLLTALIMVGCNMAIDGLDIVNGSKYIVKAKEKKEQTYWYRLIKVGDTWYDYHYEDTTNFEVGDTLIIIITSTRKVDKINWKIT